MWDGCVPKTSIGTPLRCASAEYALEAVEVAGSHSQGTHRGSNLVGSWGVINVRAAWGGEPRGQRPCIYTYHWQSSSKSRLVVLGKWKPVVAGAVEGGVRSLVLFRNKAFSGQSVEACSIFFRLGLFDLRMFLISTIYCSAIHCCTTFLIECGFSLHFWIAPPPVFLENMGIERDESVRQGCEVAFQVTKEHH